MPIPIPPPAKVPVESAVATSYHLREHQDWATRQERMRHNDAIYQVGEWVIFLLMWHDIDHQRGLVARCQKCFRTGDQLQDRVSAVYKQAREQKCSNCYGTTFEGGYRARIVRPAILTENDESEKVQKRGAVNPSSVTVDTTIDFRSRNGDYMIRADNSRWQLDIPQRTTLRSGFEHPDQADTGIAYSGLRANFEQPTTVAYDIEPVLRRQVAAVLDQPMRYPGDFSGFEIKRAPLIPPAYLD